MDEEKKKSIRCATCMVDSFSIHIRMVTFFSCLFLLLWAVVVGANFKLTEAKNHFFSYMYFHSQSCGNNIIEARNSEFVLVKT